MANDQLDGFNPKKVGHGSPDNMATQSVKADSATNSQVEYVSKTVTYGNYGGRSK